MANLKLSCYLLILLALKAQCQSFDYYWRDYYGAIPEDALPVGKDANGKDTYVAQVYIHQYGLFVAQIFPGENVVEVPCDGVRKVNQEIKILCTQHKENFSWLRTTDRSFYSDIRGKHAVVGGRSHYDNVLITLNIGRVTYGGNTKIGPLLNRAIVHLYYPHDGAQQQVDQFEVLVANPVAETTTKRQGLLGLNLNLL